MHMDFIRAEAPARSYERQFLDGSHEAADRAGDVWRYDASDRLTEILHRDKSVTTFEDDGATLHFSASGNLVWSIGLKAAV